MAKTNKERLEKLIQELQEMSSDGWELVSVSVHRGVGEDEKKVFFAEVEFQEQ